MLYRDTEAPAAVPAPPIAPARSSQRLPWRFPLSLGKRSRRIAGAAAICVLLITLSVCFIDRPVSTWVHAHLGDSRFAFLRMPYDGHLLAIGPFSLMAGPAEALGPLALFVLVLLALAAAAGKHLGRHGRIALVLSLSVLVAMDINKEAKLAFGRTWPESWLGNNPSWVRDGVFGFFPFHGGSSWGSFPSGHTTVITTFATILWLIWPKLRILWVVIVIVVITGLIGANYHFISDIIGGIFFGGVVGLGSLELMLRSQDRFGPPGRTKAIADRATRAGS